MAAQEGYAQEGYEGYAQEGYEGYPGYDYAQQGWGQQEGWTQEGYAQEGYGQEGYAYQYGQEGYAEGYAPDGQHAEVHDDAHAQHQEGYEAGHENAEGGGGHEEGGGGGDGGEGEEGGAGNADGGGSGADTPSSKDPVAKQLQILQNIVDEHAKELRQLRQEHDLLKISHEKLLAAPSGGSRSKGQTPPPYKGDPDRRAGISPVLQKFDPKSRDRGHSPASMAASSRAPASPVASSVGRHAAQTGDLFQAARPLVQQRVKDPKAQDRALATVEEAIRRTDSVNAWSGPGIPLTGAVQSRSLEFVELLLRSKADPDCLDEKGVGPLHSATFLGDVMMCKALLGARANVNIADQHEQTPLFFAPTRAVCETLFRAYADVNLVNTKGQSALHLAGKAGLGDAISWLCSRQTRATVSLRDARGRLAEDYAVEAGCRVDVIDTLRQASGGKRVVTSRVGTKSAKHITPGEVNLAVHTAHRPTLHDFAAQSMGRGMQDVRPNHNDGFEVKSKNLGPRPSHFTLAPGEDCDRDFDEPAPPPARLLRNTLVPGSV